MGTDKSPLEMLIVAPPKPNINMVEEIITFFKNYNHNKDKLISKKNLATALRRLLSRYLSGKRGDTEIDEKQQLIGQITRNDLWELNIIKNEQKFQSEIYALTFDLKVGQAYDYYKLLYEDSPNQNISSNSKNLNFERILISVISL